MIKMQAVKKNSTKVLGILVNIVKSFSVFNQEKLRSVIKRGNGKRGNGEIYIGHSFEKKGKVEGHIWVYGGYFRYDLYYVNGEYSHFCLLADSVAEKVISCLLFPVLVLKKRRLADFLLKEIQGKENCGLFR